MNFVERSETEIKTAQNTLEELSKSWGNKEPHYVLHAIETKIIFESGVKDLTYIDKTVEKIIALIKENPKTTQEELSQKTGLSRRGIEWDLQQLKKKGRLKRIGPDKGGYWKVKRQK